MKIEFFHRSFALVPEVEVFDGIMKKENTKS